MKLTIVTPVIRKENLQTIASTIPEGVNWLCVFYDEVPEYLPKKAKGISTPLIKSNWGVAKVNAALDYIKDGHIYVLDDDTVLHVDFSLLLNLSETFDFIYFNQETKFGTKRTGGEVKRGYIDIGNYIASRELIGDTYLENTNMPDGDWAEALYKKCKKPLYWNKTFSIYNYLR